MSRRNDATSTDPFEQAFFDHLEGDHKAELVIHTNKGDPEILPVAYFFRSYSEMPDLEKEALNSCRGKILDIGAGAGPHALYLQTKNFDVAALEIRQGFVEVMRRRGIKQVFWGDIEDFQEGQYDTLLLLMNGIGFTKTTEGVGRFLEHAKRLLRPGGQILCDSTDLLYLYQQEDGSVKIDLNENYYGEVVYRVEYKGKMGDPFKWLYLDYSMLSYYAEKAGFQCELMMETEFFNYLARLYV